MNRWRIGRSDFSRPCGSCARGESKRNVETLGYCRLSLRDDYAAIEDYPAGNSLWVGWLGWFASATGVRTGVEALQSIVAKPFRTVL
jgi:hypothetical protein